MYDNSETVLRALLISHFEAVAKEQYIKNYRKELLRKEGRRVSYAEAEVMVEEEDIPDIFPKDKIYSKPWEIADVCFGYDELKEAKHLTKLTKVRNTYIKNNLIIQQSKDD